MGTRYTICRWAINRSDPQNLLSVTLDVPLHHPPSIIDDSAILTSFDLVRFSDLPPVKGPNHHTPIPQARSKLKMLPSRPIGVLPPCQRHYTVDIY